MILLDSHTAVFVFQLEENSYGTVRNETFVKLKFYLLQKIRILFFITRKGHFPFFSTLKTKVTLPVIRNKMK